MNISLTDQIVSQFLSGLIAVFALIAVGGVLAIVLRGLERKFPFMRLALVLALSPLSLIQFFDYGGNTIFYIYAVIVISLGFTIDGVQYLFAAKVRAKQEPKTVEPEKEVSEEPGPGVIVWEKAE
ncbi:MAG: hypothetical protein ABFS02_06805 [Pseudomonadota bacterium]